MSTKRDLMYVTATCAVFTVRENGLNVLLVRRKSEPFKGMWAIPGGFVEADEELEDAAARELEEETGVKGIFLKQLGAYGGVRRDPLRGRVVTVSYVALIRGDQELCSTDDAEVAKWVPVKEIPRLAFDHNSIVADALEYLRLSIQTTNIALQILPQRFTLTEMQALYESVLSRRLDKRNFRKRIGELGMVVPTDAIHTGAHRPARLYRFRHTELRRIRERMSVLL